MIFSKTTVSLTKIQFRALVAHSDTDIARAHLNAIFFDASTLRGVATDGHRLAICEGEGVKGAWSYLMPREAAETALRAKGAETFILDTVRGDITAHDKQNRKVGTFEAPQPKHADTKDKDGNVTPGKVLDSPPYQQVESAPAVSHARQGFDARYLADVRLVAEAAHGPAAHFLPVRFYPGEGDGDGAQFRVGKWIVILMPCRIGKEGPEADDDKRVTGKRDKASVQAAPAPGGAIVLVGGPVDLASAETPQNAKGAPSVIVLATRPVNAASLGSDLAPIALPAPKKSRARQHREIFATTADYIDADKLRAWVEDAPTVDAPSTDRCPWG